MLKESFLSLISDSEKIIDDVIRKKYCIKEYGEQNWDDIVMRFRRFMVEDLEAGILRYDIVNRIAERMTDKYFLPAGSVLYGYKNPGNVSLGNCAYKSIESDSIEGIFEFCKQAARMYSWRQGVGTDISILRPKDEQVNNAARTSTGSISFMPLISSVNGTIGQNGRRGASIITEGVWHPDIPFFIRAKAYPEEVFEYDALNDFLPNIHYANISVKLTDRFMQAVENDEEWELIYPDIYKDKDLYNREWDGDIEKWINNGYPIKVYKKVKARALLKDIAHCAWKIGDPGVLYWDTCLKNSASGFDEDLKIRGVNPCVTGDTLVSVADGRGAVPIRQLAEEGKDVPVYCLDFNGKQTIRIMRNPRKTGFKEKIYKITLDDGTVIRCTGNHEFYVYDEKGNIILVRADELKSGMSLVVKQKKLFFKTYTTPYWMFDGKKEHREIYKLYRGEIPNGMVIHHKDFNSINNRIDNLEMLSEEEHIKIHLKTDNNPMRKWWKSASEAERKRYKENMSKATSGLKNGRAYQIDNESLKQIIKDLALQLRRAITVTDWRRYARANNLPKDSKFRNIKKLISDVNIELGLSTPEIESDFVTKRMWVTYQKLSQLTDLPLIFKNNRVYVEKVCEHCGKIFITPYNRREISFCSNECYYSSDAYKHKSALGGLAYKEKNNPKRFSDRQALINKIKEYVSRNRILPTKKEIQDFCKKYGFMDLRSLGFRRLKDIYQVLMDEYNVKIEMPLYIKGRQRKEYAELLFNNGLSYNHRVVSVEFDGYEDVYNGTVDEFHNFGIVLPTRDVKDFRNGKKLPKGESYVFHQVFTPQCGEQQLPDWGVCLLSGIVLYKYVRNPFSKDAYFDFELFEDDLRYYVRFMDYLVDVDRHPFNEQRKIELYGRKFGLEVLGLADAFAMLRIWYDSQEALDFAELLMRRMHLVILEESLAMAKEVGPAPALMKKKQRERFLEQPYINDLIFNITGDSAYTKELYNEILKYGLRNVAWTTIGPTGTLAFIADNCSSGIEPVFAFSYERNIKIEGETVKVDLVHLPLMKYLANTGQLDLLEKHSIDELKKMFFYKTAYEIDWKKRIDLQAVLQKYISDSISSTVNLPQDVDEETIYNIYLYGWKKGVKGVTIYRDGSKENVIKSKDESKDKADSDKKEVKGDIKDYDTGIDIFLSKKDDKVIIKEVLERESGEVHKVLWKQGVVVRISVILDGESPLELLPVVHRDAGIMQFNEGDTIEKKAEWNVILKLIKYALDLGIPIEEIIRQLSDTRYIANSISDLIIRYIYYQGVQQFYSLDYGKIYDVPQGILQRLNGDIYNKRYSEQGFLKRFNSWDTICRLISLLLCADAPIGDIVRILDENALNMFTIPALLSKVLKNYINTSDVDELRELYKSGDKVGVECPECGEMALIYVNGCNQCLNCGYSKC